MFSDMAKLFETIKTKVNQGVEWLKAKAKSISETIQGWVDRYKKYRESLKRHQEYIDAILDGGLEYNPEDVDIQLREKLKQVVGRLEDGELAEHIKSLSFEERKVYFEKILLPMIASEMGVAPTFIGWFQDENTIGFYSETHQGIALNELYLASDNEYVINFMINTVIHECKHAMQWDAVSGRNSHGYSEQLISIWKRNFEDYIEPRESDEGYVKQPVEWDASSFAESVFPTDKK